MRKKQTYLEAKSKTDIFLEIHRRKATIFAVIKNSIPEKLRPFFYGLAELSPAAIDIFLKVYLLLYFNKILGLSATATSFVIGLGVLWDAVIDPWIGTVSDRYYHHHGQRRTILYLSSLAVSLLFFILWRIPPKNSIFTYFLLFLISAGLNSAISFFSVPYYAIANDLEKDNQKRKSWIGSRLIFFNLGSIAGLAIPAYFLTKNIANSEPIQPYLDSVTTMIIMMILLSFISAFALYYKQIKIPARENNVPHKSINLTEIWKDKTFFQLLMAFFVVSCGLGLNSSLALYYYKTFLKFSETQTQIILVTFLAVFTLSIPLWVVLTKHFDKKKLIVFGALALGLVTIFSFPYFDDKPFLFVLSIASLLGGALVGVAVVMEIYLSDYLNEKELFLKKSVSGQFLGVWKMSSKISRSLAIAMAGPIIEISDGHSQILANFFGWGVGLFFVASSVILLLPLNKKN